MPDDSVLVGWIVVNFFANGHIEFDDTAAQQVAIGQIYKAGLELAKIGDHLNTADRLVIEDECE